MQAFASITFPRIAHPFILVTHNGAFPSGNDTVQQTMLKSKMLMKWFASNPSLEHEKLVPVPIGLPNGADHNFQEIEGPIG